MSLFETIRVKGAERRYVQSVLRLEKVCFDPSWNFKDARRYFADALNNGHNINLFLQANRRIVGYALVVAHHDAYEYLRNHDPAMKPDGSMFYLETIQVHPDFQGKGGGRMLLKEIRTQCVLEGVLRLSMHARQVNGFSRLLRQMDGTHIDVSRNIDSWIWGGGEPYEYLEISFGEQNPRFR